MFESLTGALDDFLSQAEGATTTLLEQWQSFDALIHGDEAAEAVAPAATPTLAAPTQSGALGRVSDSTLLLVAVALLTVVLVSR